MDQVNDFVLASAAFPGVYALVFAWVLIDGFFPPVPSDVVVVGLTAQSISAGVPNIWALALVAALGAIAGDNISYEIGVPGQCRVLAGAWSRANPLLSVGLAILVAITVGVLIDRSVAMLEMRHDLRRNSGIRVESAPGKAISARRAHQPSPTRSAVPAFDPGMVDSSRSPRHSIALSALSNPGGASTLPAGSRRG